MLISVPSSSERMGLFGTFLLVCLINWPRWVPAGVIAAVSVPMASSWYALITFFYKKKSIKKQKKRREKQWAYPAHKAWVNFMPNNSIERSRFWWPKLTQVWWFNEYKYLFPLNFYSHPFYVSLTSFYASMYRLHNELCRPFVEMAFMSNDQPGIWFLCFNTRFENREFLLPLRYSLRTIRNIRKVLAVIYFIFRLFLPSNQVFSMLKCIHVLLKKAVFGGGVWISFHALHFSRQMVLE
jgi:hypothetical protein